MLFTQLLLVAIVVLPPPLLLLALNLFESPDVCLICAYNMHLVNSVYDSNLLLGNLHINKIKSIACVSVFVHVQLTFMSPCHTLPFVFVRGRAI